MVIVSMELTLARIEANAAGRAWEDHKSYCWQCVRAARQRSDKNPMCASGAALYRERGETARRLAEAREAERKPIPGQLTLDDM